MYPLVMYNEPFQVYHSKSAGKVHQFGPGLNGQKSHFLMIRLIICLRKYKYSSSPKQWCLSSIVDIRA